MPEHRFVRRWSHPADQQLALVDQLFGQMAPQVEKELFGKRKTEAGEQMKNFAGIYRVVFSF